MIGKISYDISYKIDPNQNNNGNAPTTRQINNQITDFLQKQGFTVGDNDCNFCINNSYGTSGGFFTENYETEGPNVDADMLTLSEQIKNVIFLLDCEGLISDMQFPSYKKYYYNGLGIKAEILDIRYEDSNVLFRNCTKL